MAARVLGLPVPRTPAECAAATPLTAAVLRNFTRMGPPMSPGREKLSAIKFNGYALNEFPDVENPEAKDQLYHRITAGVEDEKDEAEVEELLNIVMGNPQLMEMFMNFLQNQVDDADAAGQFFSQQRPAEYDMPNYGGQYSLLNAPGSNSIPPSQQFQPLS